MIKALHAHGYYDANVTVRIDEEENNVEIFVMIQPGKPYLIQEFTTEAFSEGAALKCQALEPESLGIKMGKPAITTAILDAEQKALSLLGECGYPLSMLENQEIIADYKHKTFAVHLKIDAGPLSKFGKTTVTGTRKVKNKLFENKMAWKVDEIYDTRLVEKTQKRLLDTGLFTSVIISHDSNLNDQKQLPMRIEASETKHRSVNVGASYQTYFGPGVTVGWEHRNLSGLGRKFSLQGDFTKRTHTGTAVFFVPDFYTIDQDYVLQGQALQESIFAYHQRAYNITNRIERRIDTKYRFAAGLKFERMIVSNSVQDGTSSLLEVPLYFRWSSASNLLNPTHGATLEYKLVPTTNFSHEDRFYAYNSLTYAFYVPVLEEDTFVIAQQIMVDSILSKNLHAVPVPKRVLGGSDTELRGYRYHTVSPIRKREHKPIGGRSGIFYTFETRFRVSKSIGLVPFFDMGSVYLTSFPKTHEKWYKSAGLGFRYFSFLGPLRFDIAFPLDRRKHIDSLYRVLVSIGQTF